MPDPPSHSLLQEAPDRHSDAATLGFLNLLTESVLGLSSAEMIIAVTEQMLGGYLKASRVLIAEASPDGETVLVPQTWEAEGMPVLQATTHRLADYSDHLLAQYRAGRTHVRRDATREFPEGPGLEAFKKIRAMAAIDVPVVIDGKFSMLFVVHQAEPRDWTENEITLVRQVAERTAAEVRRARALRELQQSELRFRQMADSMPQIIWTAGADGTVDYLNRRWAEYTGMPGAAADWEREPVLHPEDGPRMAAAWAEARGSGIPCEAEIRLRRGADGAFRWFINRSVPTRDLSGRIVAWYGTLTDIHDRKEAELERERFVRTIEAERANLAAIVEKSPAFICVLRGPGHVFEFANDEYYRLVGRAGLIGLPLREALPELEGQGFFELLDEVYRTGEPYTGNEVPVLVGPEALGETRHRFVNFVYQPLRGADGSVNGIFTHGVDITGMVRARQEVATSERRRKAALEAARIGSFNIDPQTMEMESDERLRGIFGTSGDTLGYEDAFARVHPEDRAGLREKVAAATRPVDPEPYSAEHRVVHPDGSIRWVSARGGVTFREEAGGVRVPVSFDGTVADITDRKQAADDLAFQRHLLELIFRESPAAMALWRGPELIFERVNPLYQEWFGNDRPLVGKPLMEVVPELEGQGFDEMLEKVLRTGENFTGTEMLARFARAAGGPVEDRYFDFSYLRVCDPAGRPYGVYNHAVDVTGRVLSRRALERSQGHLQRALLERQSSLDAERSARAEAELASRMKDEFLATLSHELRTPLNAIMGWTEILEMIPDPHPDLTAGIEVISRNAAAQARIVEDILDMSRIISGKLRLDIRPLDLAGAIRAAAETLRPAATAKGVSLEVPHTHGPPGNFEGDAARLQQVFWNLISNAVKFTPRGGSVRITLVETDGGLEVRVADTGEGIPPQFLPHVFDRFRQVDSSTTRVHSGLGLGLSIVKQIVELHGGFVRARSEGPGKGATFVVSLPRKSTAAGAGDHHPAPEAPPRGKEQGAPRGAREYPLRGISVLAVDDEPDAVAFLQRLLTGAGATVRTALSAAEALALFRENPPAVLVSDIGMPYEDGYALIRRIRALPESQGGTAPAVALTAYTRTVDRVKALEAGFQMHVSKPVEMAELIASIAALAGHPAR